MSLTKIVSTILKQLKIFEMPTKICPSSWAIMKALESPSSRLREQLRAGSQIPATGAYPDGPPMFRRVNQIAEKWSCSFTAHESKNHRNRNKWCRIAYYKKKIVFSTTRLKCFFFENGTYYYDINKSSLFFWKTFSEDFNLGYNYFSLLRIIFRITLN